MRCQPISTVTENGEADYGLWAGTLRVSGKYYIVVEHSKDFSQPVYYSFTLKGEGVSFPIVVAQPAPAAPAAPAAAPVLVEPQPRVVSPLTGTGPDFAMRPADEWRTLQEGEFHWYAFRFAYDEKRADRPIEIRIYSDPFDGAVLTLRNAEQADQWRKEGVHQHFGCCTLFERIWTKMVSPIMPSGQARCVSLEPITSWLNMHAV